MGKLILFYFAKQVSTYILHIKTKLQPKHHSYKEEHEDYTRLIVFIVFVLFGSAIPVFPLFYVIL